RLRRRHSPLDRRRQSLGDAEAAGRAELTNLDLCGAPRQPRPDRHLQPLRRALRHGERRRHLAQIAARIYRNPRGELGPELTIARFLSPAARTILSRKREGVWGTTPLV